jgi:NAD(P)-dependent dehydrogenase (short-subunit alcohol dehydrogenase family)
MLQTNYYGTLKLSEALWPLLRENGRVVNVSSVVSRYTYNKIKPELQAKFVAGN